MLWTSVLVFLAFAGMSYQQGCTDSHANCGFFAQSCNTANIKLLCRKTCGQCSSGPTGCGPDTQTWCGSIAKSNCGNAFMKSACPTRCCEDQGGESCEKDAAQWCPGYKDECERDTYVRDNCKTTCCKNGGGNGGWGVTPKWSNWGNWGCNVQCGQGTETRSRTCETGNNCEGDAEQTRPCTRDPCDTSCAPDEAIWCSANKKNCETMEYVRRYCKTTCCKDSGGGAAKWSDWGNWECNVACGTGTQTRRRTCETGNNCEGPAVETKPCTLNACVLPEWSEWGAWNCDVTCGTGTQTRTRTCETGNNCIGAAEQTAECVLADCVVDPCAGPEPDWCDRNKLYCNSDFFVKSRCKKTCCEQSGGEGKWTTWSDWKCDAECGTGTETSSRTCQTGNNCIGDATRTRDCSLPPCPTGDCEDKDPRCPGWGLFCNYPMVIKSCPLLCKKCEVTTVPEWGAWKWEECSKPCGPGTQKGTRVCSVPNSCSGISEDTKNCKIKDCDTQVGKWDNWQRWGDCSETCGPGTRTRKRNCLGPGECPGDATISDDCNLGECEKIEWRPWRPWGKCSKDCGTGERTRTRACSVPGKCTGSSTEKSSCKIKDCEVPKLLPWEDWTKCSADCEGGTQKRIRKCSVDGQCQGMGPMEEQQDCNVDIPCDKNSWSKCSKACGTGTKRKWECRNVGSKEECMWAYEVCQLKPCSPALCDSVNDFTKRYSANHTCCKNDRLSQCGVQRVNQKIIGGIPAQATQWPWMVYLSMDSDFEFCGGALISSEWVITAGHCLIDDDGRKKVNSRWRAIIGMLEFSESVTIPSEAIISFSDSMAHPQYDFPDNDLALLKLSRSVKFHSTVGPICMPSTEEPSKDQVCFVTGWGVMNTDAANPQVSPALLQLDATVFDVDVCRERYSKNAIMKQFVPFLESSKNRIHCAGSLSLQADSCQGDSGGPLVCQKCANCGWYLTGIVSFGPKPCGTAGLPGIYTKINPYQEWIEEKTGISIPKAQPCS
ncbi:uncharacterized protein LOC120345378 isoform X1 [Styela clava]